MCRHFLKTSLQGNARDGLIKDHQPNGTKVTSGHVRFPSSGASSVARLGGGGGSTAARCGFAACTRLPVGGDGSPRPSQKLRGPRLAEPGSGPRAAGASRALAQECWGPPPSLNLPYGPASWDPGWEPSRGLGPGPWPSRPLHQAICQRLFSRGAAPGEAGWGWGRGQADVWGLLAKAPAILR